jgi:hypothetical protein
MALPVSETKEWEDEFLSFLCSKNFYQKDAAKEYSNLIFAGQVLGNDIDWDKINKAIINRWSMSGLRRVKEMAWSILKGKTNG